MTQPALEIRNLSRQFGPTKAVDGISLTVEPGEIVGFLGPNGAGKTTTLSMIAGLLQPEAGTVTLLGRPGQSALVRQGVGFLIGAPALWMELTGLEHLGHAARIVAASGWQGHNPGPNLAPEGLLTTVGISLRDGRRAVREYSQGMRQRLALAMALVGNPSLLVLDEPTNGLDPLGGPDTWSVLRQAASRGVALLVSTHLLFEVERYCDRAPMILRGRIIHEDILRMLRDPARTRTTRLLFADSTEATRVLSAIGELPDFVPSLETIPNPQESPALHLELAADAIPALLRLLIAENLPLPREITPVDASLSDLFREIAQQTPPPCP